MKYLEDLQGGLEHCIVSHDTLLLGEDIAAPYGGAFKVTKRLAEKYPNNFMMTPMSEQAFTGLGIGYALQGGYAIVEIMFGDFITLCADQLINHAAKLYDLYGSALHFVLRTPSGGYRGYGATHSQSMERLFLGIPGLQVIVPSVLYSPGELLVAALESGKPALFIENKLDYGRHMYDSNKGFIQIERTQGTVSIEVDGEPPELTLITYGGMAAVAAPLCEKMMLEDEISVQVLAISDLNIESDVLSKRIKSERLLAIEEGWAQHGVGAGLVASIKRNGVTLGARQHSIYSGKRLENEVLLQEADIVETIRDMVGK